MFKFGEIMTRRKQKPTLVEKVATETGLEVVDLDRLPQEALNKLDALVPDTEEFPEEESIPEGEPKERIYLGLHPITLEKVYL